MNNKNNIIFNEDNDMIGYRDDLINYLKGLLIGALDDIEDNDKYIYFCNYAIENADLIRELLKIKGNRLLKIEESSMNTPIIRKLKED